MTPSKQIDQFLPIYDVVKKYQIHIHAPANQVYQSIPKLNMGESLLVRLLFRLRGISSEGLKFEGFFKEGFALLADESPKEFLLGAIGCPWKKGGDLQPVSPPEFKDFNTPGFAKIVWNFFCNPLSDGSTELVTETRVQCLDPISKKQFLRYWRFIGFFSGVVRKEILKIIKMNNEKRKE